MPLDDAKSHVDDAVAKRQGASQWARSFAAEVAGLRCFGPPVLWMRSQFFFAGPDRTSCAVPLLLRLCDLRFPFGIVLAAPKIFGDGFIGPSPVFALGMNDAVGAMGCVS